MGVSRTLQNGGNPYPEGPSESRGLVCEGGPERRILHSSHRLWPPSLPEVHAGQEEIPVHVLPLRPILCTLDLHQSDENRDDPPEVMGSQDYHLYRRYADPGGDFRASISTPRNPIMDTGIPGVCGKSREVSVHCIPRNRIPGSGDQLSVNGAQPPRGETAADKRGGHKTSLSRIGDGKSPLTVHRKAKRCRSGSSPCPPLLPPLAGELEKRPCLWRPGLREHNISLPGSSRGADLVATAPPRVEWQVPTQGSGPSGHLLGCLPTGMGSIMQQCTDQRPVVTAGEVMAYQLPGNASSLPGCSDIPEGQIRSLGAVAVGQHHSSGLHQQPRGDSIPTVGRSGEIPVDVGITEGHNTDCPAHTRCVQLRGRRRVQDNEGSHRLENQPHSVLQDRRDLWAPGGGLVCVPADPSAATILQLETRPDGRGNGCFSAELGSPEGVRQPSLVPYRESSESGDGAESPGGHDCSNLEGPAMVSSHPRHALGGPQTDPSPFRSHPESSQAGPT